MFKYVISAGDIRSSALANVMVRTCGARIEGDTDLIFGLSSYGKWQQFISYFDDIARRISSECKCTVKYENDSKASYFRNGKHLDTLEFAEAENKKKYPFAKGDYMPVMYTLHRYS